MVTKKTLLRPCRRLIAQLLPAVASEPLRTECFGALGQREQLALKALAARDRPPARREPPKPPSHQPPAPSG
jgi:hypothetical protein